MTNTVNITDIDRKASELMEVCNTTGASYNLREKLHILVALGDITGNDNVKGFALASIEKLYGSEARDAVA